MFEGMTPAEDAFFERIKNAPPEQAVLFRNMFNLLMGAFGDNPPNSIVMVVHENNELLSVHALNTSSVNTAVMMATGLESVLPTLDEKEQLVFMATMQMIQQDKSEGTLQ
jgi:hypothetical protein